MNKKLNYTAPETEELVISFEEHFLDGSVGTVRGGDISGWSSGEEDW